MPKGGFKELLVWQRAKELAVLIYRLTETGQIARDYGLKDQMRRAAVSVPSNIAEGDERNTNKDAVRFLYIAKVRLELGLVSQVLEVLKRQPRGDDRMLRQVADYSVPNVSEKVLRIIISYTDYINRNVWKKQL